MREGERERERERERENQDHSIILWITLDSPRPGNTNNTRCQSDV